MDASIDSLKRYQRYFKRLLQLEREEEISFHRNEIRSLSGAAREKKGRAILGLNGRDAGRGLGGIYLIKLSRSMGLPETEIGVGDLVILSSGGPDGEEAQAFVTEKSGFHLVIAYNSPPPHYAYQGDLRLDLFANDVSFQRMQEALLDLKEHQIISDLLLGARQPRREEEMPEAGLFQPALNASQREAVQRSLAARDLFLIHGPPGTGKTTTLVESILQHSRNKRRILATADSNTAVDNLVEKLLARRCRVLRIGNPARLNPDLAASTLDQQLQEHPDYQEALSMREQITELRREQGRQLMPSGANRRGLTDDEVLKHAKRGTTARGVAPENIRRMATWLKLQKLINSLNARIRQLEKSAVNGLLEDAEVICATNVSAGSEVLREARFDVVFLDEATQSMEPSCLIPMIRANKWVLAGDHRQLPPTVLSRDAAGLHHTLFERWIELYGAQNSLLLTVQYRMHADIMAFSNREFYGGRLKASPRVRRHHLGELTGYRAPDYPSGRYQAIADPAIPVVFVDVPGGGEEQIPGSFSYFNPQEAEAVEQAVRLLMEARLFPADLGIISPYDQQVNLLRTRLEGSGIEVKTVDGYQGREKEAVIISMVRANAEGNLGFLSDYRRLNVALTRARRKLILIGHKQTLIRDPLYARLIGGIGHQLEAASP
jgi:predicted DNA helicase